MTLQCKECGTTAARIIDDNGVTDPADGDRWEKYECENGHTFTVVLRA